MYDDIRKPNLLKNIPLVFIRALPSMYYFSKFSNSNIPDNARNLFQTNVEYLTMALRLLSKEIKDSEFEKLAKKYNKTYQENITDKF